MKNNFRWAILWILIIVLMGYMLQSFYKAKQGPVELSYDQLFENLNKGQVESVIVSESNQRIDGFFTGKDKKAFFVTIGNDQDFYKALKEKKVKITIKPPDTLPIWLNIFFSAAPLILLIVIGFVIFRNMQNSGSSAFSFIQSKAKLYTSNQTKVTFADVAGVEEAKGELKEVIDFLKDPKKYTKLGAKIPKGVLLLGAPGTGKTLLARAVAGEAGVPFFSISGSEFVELFVGVGASRVRSLFEQGKKNAPCIIFIDELDAVGRRRGAGLGGGHDEREQTLNQLLVEMDGFEGNTGLIVVAATNRDDVLDSALLRPGRFDRRVVVDVPDIKGREEILKIHTRKVPLVEGVDLRTIARGTPGFTGADIANLVNESVLLAARRDKKQIDLADLEEAKDKLIMGLEKRSRVIGEKEKRISAFHEAGHALLSKLIKGAEPLHKVSIIPRGMALGITASLPKEDRHLRLRQEFFADIKILLAGRVSEEMFFEDVSTGAQSDLERATEISRRMICEYGMSEKLGLRTYGNMHRQVFLGADYMKEKDYSEDTAKLIDDEVSKIMSGNYKEAKKVMMKNKVTLERLANALLEHETLDSSQVDEVLGNIKVTAKPIYSGKSDNPEDKKDEKISKEKVSEIPSTPKPVGDLKTVDSSGQRVKAVDGRQRTVDGEKQKKEL